MFMLIWIILLPSYAGADQPELGFPWCYKEYCVTLNKDVITAETGLCAVIHCSWNTPSNFNPTSLVWFKCEPGRSCTDSDIIFHSRNKSKIQSRFSGRVSLLEPDVSQRNCSIIINDLQLSDSGRYHFRVNSGRSGYGFTSSRATVSVKALQQKPTVQTPALTEGQRAALTCTAPGLCSGSEPTFTWTWRGAGDAPPNVTTATTDRLTPVSHRHSSTLELTASAELHGAELSCTVSYNHSSSSTQDSVRINVTYVKDLEVSGDTVVKEGDSLNVTCSVDSFPPSRLMWFGPNKTRVNVSETTERSNQTDLRSASLLIHNVTQAQSGQYMCEGIHLNSSQTRDVHIFVIYLRKPVLVGHTSVEEGSALNLTCTVDSFPPSNVTVGKRGLEVTKPNETHFYKTDPGSASLVIMNVTPENAGIYECTVQHELKKQTTHADVEVLYMRDPVIFGDTVVKEGGALNLTCRVDSFPLTNVTLTKVGSETTVQNETIRDQHDPGTGTLVIDNVTREDAGRYVCTGLSQDKTLDTYVDVRLMLKPLILNSSGCVYDGDVLSCSCISRASPVPTVTWPLLQHRSEYTLVTTVTGDTVHSSLVLRASGHNRTGVQCVSSNRAGQVQERLTPSITDPQRTDPPRTHTEVVSKLELLLAFGLGFLLSAALCCLVVTCRCRRKPRSRPSHRDVTTEEMLSRNAAEEANANGEPTELLYANIDFVAMLGKGHRVRRDTEDVTKTEYAEIKKEIIGQTQDNSEREERPAEEEEEEEGEEEEEEGAVMEETTHNEQEVNSNIQEMMTDE